MKSRLFIAAATLLATFAATTVAQAKCPPGSIKIGNACTIIPNNNPIRDNRCPASQGGNCVGPERDPVVPPPPRPPIKHPLPPTDDPQPAPINNPPKDANPDPTPQPEPQPPAPDDGDKITCKEGRRIVKNEGYRKVFAIDCDAPVYKYLAKKDHHRFIVKVNDDGDIIDEIDTDN